MSADLACVQRAGLAVKVDHAAQIACTRTGGLNPDEWNRYVTVADENREPLPPDERPMRVALLTRQPVSRRMWSKHHDGPWRQIQVTALPVIGEGDHILGVMNIFWVVE